MLPHLGATVTTPQGILAHVVFVSLAGIQPEALVEYQGKEQLMAIKHLTLVSPRSEVIGVAEMTLNGCGNFTKGVGIVPLEAADKVLQPRISAPQALEPRLAA